MEKNKKKLFEVIANYAKENGIKLHGNSYQTYSMLKYPAQHFPEGKMFISDNVRGEQNKKNVIIVAQDENTISHFKTENVLERPMERIADILPQEHRFITASFDLSLSF